MAAFTSKPTIAGASSSRGATLARLCLLGLVIAALAFCSAPQLMAEAASPHRALLQDSCADVFCIALFNVQCCGGQCFQLLTDPSHCGACFNACPEGQSCVKGVCGGGV